MVLSVNAYNKMPEYIGDGTMDLDTDSFKMALCSALTFTATNTVWANVSSTEIAGSFGYVTGGQALTSVTWTESSGTVTFTSASPTWSASGGAITATDSVLYDDTATSDELLFMIDFDATESAGDGTDFIINTPGSGWFTAAVS